MMKRKMWIGALSAIMLLGGTAAVAASGSSDGQNVTGTKDSQQAYITVEQAKTAALKVAKGRVDDVELERKHGKVYYEVEIEKSGKDVDVHIDAVSGKVLAVLDKDTDDDNDDDRDNTNGSNSVLAEVKFTTEQASAIAAKAVSGGKVVKVELDEDDNRYIYEVDLRTSKGEVEVDVDAHTGKVLSVDQDFDDED